VIIRVKIETDDVTTGCKPVSEIVITSVNRGKKPTNDYRVRLFVPEGTVTPEAKILGHVEEHGVYSLVRKALSVLGPQIELIRKEQENG
jgi:hypothetical protein